MWLFMGRMSCYGRHVYGFFGNKWHVTIGYFYCNSGRIDQKIHPGDLGPRSRLFPERYGSIDIAALIRVVRHFTGRPTRSEAGSHSSGDSSWPVLS